MNKVHCYFNQNGYYIRGEGIEVCRSFSPRLDNEIRFLYCVLVILLDEIDRRETEAHYYIYNDSRVIDDMNGATPMDVWCDSTRAYINARLLPDINGLVLFKKKPADTISSEINLGKETLLLVDPTILQKHREQVQQKIDETKNMLARDKIKRLKGPWTTEEFKEKWYA